MKISATVLANRRRHQKWTRAIYHVGLTATHTSLILLTLQAVLLPAFASPISYLTDEVPGHPALLLELRHSPVVDVVADIEPRLQGVVKIQRGAAGPTTI